MLLDPDKLSIAVGIATRGRAGVLRETIARLRNQTRLADLIVVCGTDRSDVAGIDPADDLEIRLSIPGSCRQRNAIIERASCCDILLFLDDDFFVQPSYIERTLATFIREPDVVVTTGHVFADGAVGPGLTVEQGLGLLEADREPTGPSAVEPAFNGYGCNMALRVEPLIRHALRFDERLPLYAWFEDVDLTRRLGRHGRIVKVPLARGVHLGVKVGRTSGTRLGYSQVANPIYLARKGVYPWPRVLRDISRHLLVNCVKSFRPEPYIDRRGRLRGNLRAFADLLRGRLRPERILSL